MKIRKYGDRDRHPLTCPPPGRTKQAMVAECDINTIMNKWKRTGEIPPGNPRPPTYGDFSEVGDYMQAKNSILEADRAFEALPSWVRERFQNSPHELIAFLEDPSNQAEAEKLGLTRVPDPELEPTPEPTPAPAPEADPEPPLITPPVGE